LQDKLAVPVDYATTGFSNSLFAKYSFTDEQGELHTEQVLFLDGPSLHTDN
jgi:hypothetical protein